MVVVNLIKIQIILSTLFHSFKSGPIKSSSVFVVLL